MPRSKRDVMEGRDWSYRPPVSVKVNIIVHFRGWGSKIDEVREFETLALAEVFVHEFNSRNTEKTVPDWYMIAEIVR